MAEAAAIAVEVAYATPDRQTVIALSVPAGTTVAGAIALSGIAAIHPEIDTQSAALGIFGRRVAQSARPRDGDRIEIYRPLQADPKHARRRRARRR